MSVEERNMLVKINYINCDICGRHIQEIMYFPDESSKVKDLDISKNRIIIGDNLLETKNNICNDCVNKIVNECCKQLSTIGFKKIADINDYQNPIL